MSRRDRLVHQPWETTSHAGLWLDKFIGEDQGNDKAKQGLVEQVSATREPDAYAAFFARWRDALQSLTPETQNGVVTLREAEVVGRMAVGLGAEGVLETAISLHRTYGVPVIPGSALKGLASSFAHKRLGEEWEKGSDAHTTVFGNTVQAGYVTFFDALYVPGSGFQRKALWPDVITVHHPNYYQGNEPPADWDSPTPVPFLSATGRYLLALAGPAVWVKAAFDILALALKEEGVGAKTSSGYGRMTLL